MIRLSKAIAGAVLIAAIGAGAIVAQHAMPGHGMMDQASMQKMMQDMMPQPSDTPSTKAFKEGHMKMMKGMHMTFTGRTDEDFVRGMIPHHQGAIDMAKIELEHGKDPEIRKLAQKVIDDQQREIGEMQAWLKKNAK